MMQEPQVVESRGPGRPKAGTTAVEAPTAVSDRVRLEALWAALGEEVRDVGPRCLEAAGRRWYFTDDGEVSSVIDPAKRLPRRLLR